MNGLGIDNDTIRCLKKYGNTVIPSAALKRWKAQTIEKGLSEILGEKVWITEFTTEDKKKHYIARTKRDYMLSKEKKNNGK